MRVTAVLDEADLKTAVAYYLNCGKRLPEGAAAEPHQVELEVTGNGAARAVVHLDRPKEGRA